jgi:hypothetical protein
MSRAAFILFACVLWNAVAPAAAADIVAHRQGVLIQGRILKGDYAKIVQFVRHPDNYGRFARSVFLDSPGGDLVETVRIAHLLEKSHAVDERCQPQRVARRDPGRAPHPRES